MENTYYDIAKNLHKHGKLEEAKSYFQKALEEAPNSPEILRDYALLLIDIEDYKEALETIEKAISLKEEPYSFYIKGRALFGLGKFEEAEKIFLELKPVLKDAINISADLGDLYFDAGDYEKAITEYKEAIALDPFDPILFNNLALCYFHTDDYDSAIETLRSALQLDPENPEIHDNLAMALYEKGNVNEAIQELQKAIELDANFVQAHVDLSLIYYESELYEEAIDEIKKAIEIEPDNSVYHAILSNIYLKAGKLKEAKEETEKLIKLIKPDEKDERPAA
ncbi:MAG: tetratricopeptide repeat protein [candidate division WOR-3 bacterium]